MGQTSMDCEPGPIFQLTTYELPKTIALVCRIVCINAHHHRTNLSLSFQFGLPQTVDLYPFVLHSLSLSIFSSVIGPFGGFFASGFKRAFKIKDFGDIIPGHGGIMDRFDCQYLMATFVNVYISSFIRCPSPQKLYQHLIMLNPEDLKKIYVSIGEHLRSIEELSSNSTIVNDF